MRASFHDPLGGGLYKVKAFKTGPELDLFDLSSLLCVQALLDLSYVIFVVLASFGT